MQGGAPMMPPPASARPMPPGGIIPGAPGGVPPGVAAPPGHQQQQAAPAVAPGRGGGIKRLQVQKGGNAGLGESEGLRDRGPAPVSSETHLSGAPKPKKNQRGTEDSPEAKASKKIQDAIEQANDPTGKLPKSNLP